jgi:hypothetical protein
VQKSVQTSELGGVEGARQGRKAGRRGNRDEGDFSRNFIAYVYFFVKRNRKKKKRRRIRRKCEDLEG